MTFIDLENKGTIFELEGGGSVELRVSTPELWKDINKKTVTKKIVYNKHGRFIEEEKDDDIQSEMLWDFCIVSWKGLYSDKECKKPILCNRENKILMMNRSLKFSSFIAAKITELANLEQEKEASAEKN